MLNAARYFGHQLPEVFAGFSRIDTRFPIDYPTATRPHVFAAGTPVLLLRLLLGLRPNRERYVLETDAPELPSWAGTLKLSGVRAYDRSWEVRIDEGQVRIEQEE
jgi:hypothetical protein